MADTIIDHEALDIELLEQVNGGMNLLRKSGSDKTLMKQPISLVNMAYPSRWHKM